MNDGTEIVMYIVINSDLKMSPGKIAAQVAHVAVKAYNLGLTKNLPSTEKWYAGSYTKIILKGSENQLRWLLNDTPTMTVQTIDEGRTEIPKGSLTAMAYIPMCKANAPMQLKELKLL